MTDVVTQLPTRRADLIIRPIGEQGRYVVKNPGRREYFEIGEQERFLLAQLDGRRTAEQICAAFEQKFGEPLSDEELDGFLDMARTQGLLEGAELAARNAEPTDDTKAPRSASRVPRSKQSILYWRKSVFDPDRFFNWLEPKIRFFWTRGFLIVSAGCILLATMLLWTGRQEAATSFAYALRWETILLAWLVMLAVGTLHEFAHGLTCKHYGGEVREIGFLLMYFMPCFYCNVSDAWLFREKSKRLWVTLAGGYFELFLWALAVFVWRVTVPDSLVNYLAFIVLALSGIDSFFNFNPLIKLDGYYLLSDWMEIPNLRQRSFQYTMGRLRWLLWGAARPGRHERGRFLLGFGITSWVYSLTFLSLMIFAMSRFAGAQWGPLGFATVALVGVVSMKGLLTGISAGEVTTMVFTRHARTIGWLAGLGSLAAVLCLVEIDDRAGGPCEFRSAVRAEVRAPVAGFIREVCVEEGERVSPGAPVVYLEIPDLDTRLAQKQAEVSEAEAQLRLLEIGARPEEIDEQRRRVERAASWRDLARHELAQLRQALHDDLARLAYLCDECRAERDAALDSHARTETLFGRKAVAQGELREAQRRVRVCQARLAQTEAEQRVRQAQGTLEAETELARREKEFAEAQAALAMLEAGSRPEEIETARARLTALQEEARYLERLAEKLAIHSPLSGLVTTPRMTEKLGQYVEEGALICTVEETATLEVAVALPEEALERVEVGQPVTLKARGCPYDTFLSRVDRIAPVIAATITAESPHAAAPADSKNVTVYCRLDDAAARLRPGMSGYARIRTGRRPIAAILADRTLRFLRTEFWW